METLMEHGQIFIILACLFGLYMTWGIGANDVANAMGAPVGSGAVTIKQAILIAAVFEFAGAVLAGGHVTETIRNGIIEPRVAAASPELLVFGMLGALLGSAIWLMLATSRGWPVSTTHSIVGAIVGFAVTGIGAHAVQWEKMGAIVGSWIISPLLGGALSFVLMVSIRRLILDHEHPFQQARTWAPFYVFLVGWTVCLVSLFKGLDHLDLDLGAAESFILATVVGGIMALIGRVMVNRVTHDEGAEREYHFANVEKVFSPLMVFTACAMAFAHGSNDVANGIGPMAAVVEAVRNVQAGAAQVIGENSPLPLWILLSGGGAIVVGLATYGYRVMETIGNKITELTPTRGYSATLAAALTVVLASRTGLPVSTTHVAVGAVMGVGLARGIGAIDLRVLGGIIVSWLLTLPSAAFFAIVAFYILRGLFG